MLDKLSFSARATGEDLYLEVMLDGATVYSGPAPLDTTKILAEFDDSIEQDHVLEIKMSGKTSAHTVLDESGNISQDRCVQISDFKICDIMIGHAFTVHSIYEHDTNGTTEIKQERFFGEMGCNGTVSFRFSTPIYIWLLENI